MSRTGEVKEEAYLKDSSSPGNFWQEALDVLVNETGVSLALIVGKQNDRLSIINYSSSKESEIKVKLEKCLDTIFDKLIHNGETLIFPDNTEDDGIIFKDMGILSFLGVPIFKPDGRVYGSLGLIDTEHNCLKGECRRKAIRFCKTFEDQFQVAKKMKLKLSKNSPDKSELSKLEKIKNENITLKKLVSHICEETRKSVRLIRSFVELGLDRSDMTEIIFQKILNETEKLYHVKDIPPKKEEAAITKQTNGNREIMFQIMKMPDTILDLGEEDFFKLNLRNKGGQNLPKTELDLPGKQGKKIPGPEKREEGDRQPNDLPKTEINLMKTDFIRAFDIEKISKGMKTEFDSNKTNRVKNSLTSQKDAPKTSKRQAVRSVLKGKTQEKRPRNFKKENSLLSYEENFTRKAPSREFPKVCPCCRNANRQIAKFCADCGCSFQEQRDRLIKKGKKEFDTKNLEKAMEYYDKILTFEPDDLEVLFKEGLCLVSLRKSDEAIKCYDKVLKKDPYNVRALSNKGHVFLGINKPAEAVRCFDRVLKIEPRNKQAKLDLSMAVTLIGAIKRTKK